MENPFSQLAPKRYLNIGNMLLDTSRGLLQTEEGSRPLEPRVMNVLLVLAQNPGEVVSHNTLQDQVWGNTVVEANALQRCIGKLRKSMGDSARTQKHIATHPKIGYSLLGKVSWSEQPDEQTHLTAARPNWYFPALAATAAVLVFILFALTPFGETSTAPSLPDAAGLETLDTSPDFIAAYSPDNRWLSYPKKVDGAGDRLWLKELATGSELSLTSLPGHYTWNTWSSDSNRIAFINEASCYSLAYTTVSGMTTADHGDSPEVLEDCVDTRLASPQWTGPHTLVYIREQPDSVALVSRNIHGKSHVIKEYKKNTPYFLSWSRQLERLVIALLNEAGGTDITVLNLKNGESHLVFSSEVTGAHLFPVWSPDGKDIVFSENGKTLIIDRDGIVKQQEAEWIPVEL